jgi:hypothetical protein
MSEVKLFAKIQKMNTFFLVSSLPSSPPKHNIYFKHQRNGRHPCIILLCALSVNVKPSEEIDLLFFTQSGMDGGGGGGGRYIGTNKPLSSMLSDAMHQTLMP